MFGNPTYNHIKSYKTPQIPRTNHPQNSHTYLRTYPGTYLQQIPAHTPIQAVRNQLLVCIRHRTPVAQVGELECRTGSPWGSGLSDS